MPDGCVIRYPKAKDTLVEVVKLIGAERIRNLGFKWCKIPFISNTRDEKYGKAQHPVGGGWLVLTHSGTDDKKKQIDKIAHHSLGLDIKVEIIDPKGD